MEIVKKILVPTLVLMIISGLIALLLSVTYNFTGIDKLGDGFTDAELVEYTAMVLPNSSGLVKKETTFTDKNFLGVYEDKDKNGLALHVTTKGYGGNIGVLIGFSNEGVIEGVTIVKSTETPGLGTKIENPDYLAKYVGISGSAQDVDTITSATISSKALRTGVDFAFTILEEVKGGIAQ